MTVYYKIVATRGGPAVIYGPGLGSGGVRAASWDEAEMFRSALESAFVAGQEENDDCCALARRDIAFHRASTDGVSRQYFHAAEAHLRYCRIKR